MSTDCKIIFHITFCPNIVTQQQQQIQQQIQQQQQRRRQQQLLLHQHQQHEQQSLVYQWLKNRLREKKRRIIELKGIITKIAGQNKHGYINNSNLMDATFNFPLFLKYKQLNDKLYISDQNNQIIRSIKNISSYIHGKCNGKLELEVGQPKKEGYSDGDRNTCKLRRPIGFDWDMNDNMYICNYSCVCKVDSKSNQVSLVAGHGSDTGYKDGKNEEARFNYLTDISCYQQNKYSFIFYLCDYCNHCIRMINITSKEKNFLTFFKKNFTNHKTTTFAGKGQEYGDADGTLQSARFFYPWDIVKDDENDDILYISDSYNHKIKMIDMKKGMVSTLVGDRKKKSILNYPQQMQIIDSFIYVTCHYHKDCIVKIDKHSKQVTKIQFSNGKQVSSYVCGIIYHELDQCFYVSDLYNIYKLE